MPYKNTLGRLGKGTFHDPETGEAYPSLNAYRQARRLARQKRLQEKVEMERGYEKEKDDHFQAWIAERCITELKVGQQRLEIECPVGELRKCYEQWCQDTKAQPYSPQTWGRWLGARFLKIARNALGIGRVYHGIALKPPTSGIRDT